MTAVVIAVLTAVGIAVVTAVVTAFVTAVVIAVLTAVGIAVVTAVDVVATDIAVVTGGVTGNVAVFSLLFAPDSALRIGPKIPDFIFFESISDDDSVGESGLSLSPVVLNIVGAGVVEGVLSLDITLLGSKEKNPVLRIFLVAVVVGLMMPLLLVSIAVTAFLPGFHPSGFDLFNTFISLS